VPLGFDDAALAAAVGVDVETLTALNDAAEALLPEAPEVRAARDYEHYVAQRNHNWMFHVRRLLARPGTFFVAVGAGHFEGTAALQTLISAEPGVTITRVQ